MMNKRYRDMEYEDFMDSMDDYILSLEKEDGFFTKEEWAARIIGEFQELREEITDEQVGWMILQLRDDGYVREEI